ncbi:TagK domain-containing protein [Paraburkholderia aromaticivorans]|uniref:TagK domain-containing protein n=1 Tax=Paraburkholderia aromaticivorans TaxID=2026199 RepID=UPI001F0DE857|nr:TagK domain-containing protein [Paraburkholderia aromaticivorans]
MPEDMHLAGGAVDDPLDACEYDAENSIDEDFRGTNAIFGLIGGALGSANGESRRERDGAGNGANDLIETLHEQYRRVLDDPRASLANGWEEQSAFSAGRHPPSHYEASAGTQAPHIGSIEALLSGARFMEDAFGPLAAAQEADLAAPEPVPEILGLFAPEEYLAAAARRARALPPALARREHHTLGLDSPLPAPHSMTHKDAR